MNDFFAVNKNSWNNRVEAHLQSEFYDVQGFLAGKSSLNSIELALLGNLEGKKVLHLQCHFGQDTISLSRLGALATGIDLSDKAIESARQLAEQTKSTARFICCNLYDLTNHLDEQFDVVFTSYGTISWLPDLDKWAAIVGGFLKPGGRFVFVEFHPVVWMFDDDFSKVAYSYFNKGPIIESESGTYANRDAELTLDYVCWNHSMSEVVNSLISNDLEIKLLEEYDYSPYNCFRHTEEFEPGRFRIKHLGNQIPMVFAVVAQKK
ncbi:MAG: class I SAM-dependent methyltransferase [Saprospiraceae bacterium]|nr:class I SAM-dependent methyltransferase [Saprospiraceae bacterium]